ncbi:MAG: hypothetical protein WCJ14_09035 [Verrucomicrobiota bacterium]
MWFFENRVNHQGNLKVIITNLSGIYGNSGREAIIFANHLGWAVCFFEIGAGFGGLQGMAEAINHNTLGAATVGGEAPRL